MHKGILHPNAFFMVQYTDIHLEDLKNLSIQSFTGVLINDLYPFLFSELDKVETCVENLRNDYDVDVLSSVNKRIYREFDEMYRKEKLVLFPFLLKLDEENKKSESCAPFKTTKQHYTNMMQAIENAKSIVADFFVSSLNIQCLENIQYALQGIQENLTNIQQLKDSHFYKKYKSCSGCSNL